MLRRFPVAGLALAASLASSAARAEPWFGWRENALEDRYADGEFDPEDRIAMRAGGRSGSGDVHGESWVSLVGFEKELLDGRREIGGMVVVGLALDRIAQGPVHRVADPPHPMPVPVPAPAPAPASVPAPAPVLLLAPALARACVAAAWRASGLGVDDTRIDAIVARSRSSAWLPETRMRAMRRFDDGTHATTLAASDGTTYVDTTGAATMLELRLTWRLDRLLYADDEPTLERVRLERQDARSRVAARTLEALFAWQRATLDEAAAPASSRERVDALLRIAEAEATLDVLTGGWFSARDAPPPQPPQPAPP